MDVVFSLFEILPPSPLPPLFVSPLLFLSPLLLPPLALFPLFISPFLPSPFFLAPSLLPSLPPPNKKEERQKHEAWVSHPLPFLSPVSASCLPPCSSSFTDPILLPTPCLQLAQVLPTGRAEGTAVITLLTPLQETQRLFRVNLLCAPHSKYVKSCPSFCKSASLALPLFI